MQSRDEPPRGAFRLSELVLTAGSVAINDALDLWSGELQDICRGMVFSFEPSRYGRAPRPAPAHDPFGPELIRLHEIRATS